MRWLILERMELASLCGGCRDQLLTQPASAITSVAFVVAGAALLARRRPLWRRRDAPVHDRQNAVYGILVSGIGVGSFVQHGPHPDWQAYAHDLPIAAVMAFVAADAVSDLTARELSPAWWLVPTGAMVPVVASGATLSTIVQTVMATGAIGLSLVRARRRPQLRGTVRAALVILAAGASLGALMDRASQWQTGGAVGHAIWHVLAAAALWRLAPVVGARLSPAANLVGPWC